MSKKLNPVEMAQKIAIEVAAHGGSTYFVSGCMRDDILGIKDRLKNAIQENPEFGVVGPISYRQYFSCFIIPP